MQKAPTPINSAIENITDISFNSIIRCVLSFYQQQLTRVYWSNEYPSINSNQFMTMNELCCFSFNIIWVLSFYQLKQPTTYTPPLQHIL